MNRDEIIQEVTRHSEFFRGLVEAFCEHEEQAIADLERWAQDPVQEGFREARQELREAQMESSNVMLSGTAGRWLEIRAEYDAKEGEIAKRCAPTDWVLWQPFNCFEYIRPFDAPLFKSGDFHAPPDVALLHCWLLGQEACRAATAEEQLLIDGFLLAVAHDKAVETYRPHILSREYQGRFLCDKLCAALWDHVQARLDGFLTQAFEGVRPRRKTKSNGFETRRYLIVFRETRKKRLAFCRSMRCVCASRRT
jgi:hypothetical protein